MVWSRTLATFRLYLRALQEARGYWSKFTLILFLGLLGTPIALLTPLPVKMVVDNVLSDEPLPGVLAWWLPQWGSSSTEAILIVTIALAVFIAIVTIAHQTAEWLLREYVAEKMVLDFRGKLFLHSLQMSVLHLGEKGSHEPAYRINYDAPALQWTALYGIIPVIISLVSLAGMLYVMFLINPRLAGVALITSVPLIILIHLNQIRMRDQWHEVRTTESAAQSVVLEALGALPTVTIFGQDRHELQRFLHKAKESFFTRMRVVKLEGGFGVLLGLAIGLGTTAILYLGVRDVQGGALTTGDLLLIMGYIGQLYGPLQAIGSHITGQQRAIASAERAFSVLDQEPHVSDKPDALPLLHTTGRLELDHVTFGYAGNEPVIDDVSLTIPAGARVGIVGRSGAGKTTLVNLLIRMFDPDRGQILLDGIDLRDYRLKDMRRQFSVVSQDAVLFSTTIAENIAYARPEATMEEIVEAAKFGNAHHFIEALPEGYQTLVGERGVRLSGGERQRISLARAFLKNAPILICDEPTSAVDVQTEREITRLAARLMQGRTVIIISHRLSVLQDVDFILRVKEGQVLLEANELKQEILKAS